MVLYPWAARVELPTVAHFLDNIANQNSSKFIKKSSFRFLDNIANKWKTVTVKTTNKLCVLQRKIKIKTTKNEDCYCKNKHVFCSFFSNCWIFANINLLDISLKKLLKMILEYKFDSLFRKNGTWSGIWFFIF